MIMHHIKDSHEFHIMDINGHAVSFPLPIILWTDNGLVSFYHLLLSMTTLEVLL
ncbi:MAG: hypothetical protein CM15mP121_0600 [Bacteroidota bacterium]|nr:MAG: hypothetical protein CM15mP121_0600 [Bacteroidota bacterium]